ncbi:MAG: hypothetical protein AAF639_29210 [Chloroflexota bacterium]
MEKTVMIPISESIYQDIVKEADASNSTVTQVANFYLTVDAPVPNEYNRLPEEDEVADTLENREVAFNRLITMVV